MLIILFLNKIGRHSRIVLRIGFVEGNKYVDKQFCVSRIDLPIPGAEQMTLGLTFAEFVEFERKPLVRSDHPLTLAEAAEHIRRRGYDCRPQSLCLLVEGKLIEPADCLWTKEKIEAACDFFETQRFFTPYVEMCRVLGCRYRTFLKALRDAAKCESHKYGVRVLEDDQLFVMHRIPARDGNEAIVSFTL